MSIQGSMTKVNAHNLPNVAASYGRYEVVYGACAEALLERNSLLQGCRDELLPLTNRPEEKYLRRR